MNETGTPQPGQMGEDGTATAQPLEGLASASGSPLFWFAQLPLEDQVHMVLPGIVDACANGNVLASQYLATSPHTRVIAHWVKTCYAPDEPNHFMQWSIAVGVADKNGDWRDSNYLYIEVCADADTDGIVAWENWEISGCSDTTLITLLGDWIKLPFTISRKPDEYLFDDDDSMTLAEFIQDLRPWMANAALSHEGSAQDAANI